MAVNKELQAKIDAIVNKYVDEGLLIEAGFAAFRLTVLPLDVGPVQLLETRLAFFAGAQHLFGSIMGILEPGEEPTDNDLRRMDRIANELDAFIKAYSATLAGKGRA